jgi:hypothetical protein
MKSSAAGGRDRPRREISTMSRDTSGMPKVLALTRR